MNAKCRPNAWPSTLQVCNKWHLICLQNICCTFEAYVKSIYTKPRPKLLVKMLSKVDRVWIEGACTAPPASLIPLAQEFPYCGSKIFFHMALRLKDPEVFSHFYRSHFEIWYLIKFIICLYNYNGKHLNMMKYNGKSSLWKVGMMIRWI